MEYLANLQTAYLEKLQPTILPAMQKIQEIAKKQEIPIVCNEVGRLLCLLSALKQPKKILELGTGISYSTHWMLLNNPKTTITSIDQNKDRIMIAKKFLAESGFLAKVQLFPIWIEDFFLKNKEKFDMIFLDSQKSLYQKMFLDIVIRLKKKGLLVVDNSLFKRQVFLEKNKIQKKYKNATLSIQNFNNLIFQAPDLKSFLFSLGDGVLIATKN